MTYFGALSPIGRTNTWVVTAKVFLVLFVSHAYASFSDYGADKAVRVYEKTNTCNSRFIRAYDSNSRAGLYYNQGNDNELWKIIHFNNEIDEDSGNPIVLLQSSGNGSYLTAIPGTTVFYDESITDNAKFEIIGSDKGTNITAFKSVAWGTYLSGGEDCSNDIQLVTKENEEESLSDNDNWLLMEPFYGKWSNHGTKVGSIKYLHQVYDEETETWIDQSDEYCVEQHGAWFGYDVNDYPQHFSNTGTDRIILSSTDDSYATEAVGCRSRSDVGSGSCTLYHAPYPRKFFSCGERIPTETPSSTPTRAPTKSPTSSPTGRPTSFPSLRPTSSPTSSSVPSVEPTLMPSTGPTFTASPTMLCMTFTSLEYNEDNVKGFCDGFPDGQKCCTDDEQGSNFNFEDACSIRDDAQPSGVTLCHSSCQGPGSCQLIGKVGTNHTVSIGVGSCVGTEACFGIAKSSQEVISIDIADNACRGYLECIYVGDYYAKYVSIGNNACSSDDWTSCHSVGRYSAEIITIEEDSCGGVQGCRFVGRESPTEITVATGQCNEDAECYHCGRYVTGTLTISDAATQC